MRHLQARRDVVVQAPTGAGKTYIFELLARAGLKGQAVYTVPTRALANDKLAEWRSQGWNVGITTGDLAENVDAPVVVATLETQKGRLLRNEGPALLVIDEYQMLGDPVRGVNYELAIAAAPPKTQLLLLSGSVANPDKVMAWLRRIGRQAVLVNHAERPVPQEEIFVEALPDRVPTGIRGFWPRIIARALMADLGPILVFAPRRKAAEELARQISAALPLQDLLSLTPEQSALADDRLLRLLRNRVAYHHSGLSYPQRAGLIEPLAKAGQLRVVVATTGLAAGINFSMRTVLVTDREYQSGTSLKQVRPDELLQMFGRAGRRGLDDRGYILVVPGKPRLSEARPLVLHRCEQTDWPSLLAVMREAARTNASPAEAAQRVTQRLFTDHPPELGLARFISAAKQLKSGGLGFAEAQPEAPAASQKIVEMMNSAGQWERRRPPVKTTLGQALAFDKGWKPAINVAASLKRFAYGNLTRLNDSPPRTYGRQVALAAFPKKEGQNKLLISKWFHKALAAHWHATREDERPPSRFCSLERLEQEFVPLLPALTEGGRPVKVSEVNGHVMAFLDYAQAPVLARVDTLGKPLLNPPEREVEPPPFPTFAMVVGPSTTPSKESIADTWHRLGLIDAAGRPTRRGVIFSFFNHGEGLAIAAALEDPDYAVDDLVLDLANLRAGHRFAAYDHGGGRIGRICRHHYQGATCPGYLHQGVPTEYGDGASEVLAKVRADPGIISSFVDETLRPGDIERSDLEWRSLLQAVAHAPDFDWGRWRALQKAARGVLATRTEPRHWSDLPKLSASQRTKFSCLLRLR